MLLNMKKLEISNIILLSISLLLSIIYLLSSNFGGLNELISHGIDDFYGLGLPQIMVFIVSIIYIALIISIFNKNKNKIINAAYLTNISGFVLSLLLIMLVIIITIRQKAQSPYNDYMISFILGIFFSTYIWMFFIGLSFIIFLIGYIKLKRKE